MAENPFFFESYKGREIVFNESVDVYRNLHTNNGFSIRSTKSGLVLAHCSTVTLKDCSFVVSENGRLKTVEQKRKRVHAFVRGKLVGVNQTVNSDYDTIYYNPYHTPLFLNLRLNQNVRVADEVICEGKFCFMNHQIEEEQQLSIL